MMEYQTIMNKIKKYYAEILGNNLVGIYVHGSIAFNCYNRSKSDIDFIVVVNEALEIETKLELMKPTVELNRFAPLEMSIVLKKYCSEFKYPTPYELHFSNIYLNWYNTNPQEYCENMIGVDKDLAAHFTVIKTVGIVLFGDNINGVFGDIPKEYYLDSIKNDIVNANDQIKENPVYIILNLCRILAFINDGLILSKEQGGKWGLSNIESRFRVLINDALDSYTSNNTMVLENDENAMAFCNYMFTKIFD